MNLDLFSLFSPLRAMQHRLIIIHTLYYSFVLMADVFTTQTFISPWHPIVRFCWKKRRKLMCYHINSNLAESSVGTHIFGAWKLCCDLSIAHSSILQNYLTVKLSKHHNDMECISRLQYIHANNRQINFSYFSVFLVVYTLTIRPSGCWCNTRSVEEAKGSAVMQLHLCQLSLYSSLGWPGANHLTRTKGANRIF